MVASSCPAQLRVGGPGARCMFCFGLVRGVPSNSLLRLVGFLDSCQWTSLHCGTCFLAADLSFWCRCHGLIPKMKLPCLLCFPAVALRLRITAGKVKCSCMPNLVLCPVGLAKCIVSFWIWDPLVTCIRPQERFPPKSPLG